ncbi:MAG: S8 family peptidase [Flavobacteriales bacterium]|nr:hypothetical protein [Flavobacteriales bacterium]MCC6578246.1 S8 family peptidase [Flavobacteriales bacterium]
MRLLYALLFATLLLPAAQAQQARPYGLQLEHFLRRPHRPGAAVDLLLRGERGPLAAAVHEAGGRVKAGTGDLLSVTVPVDRVRGLARNPTVRAIEFSMDRGRVLNDSMRVKNHVNEVHAGLPPLLQGYTGAGTIIGIIDSGLDLLHPDFLDSLGHTRVLHYWDQTLNDSLALAPQPYGYGQAYDSAAINAGQCPAEDQFFYYGHGTTVAGTAAGNGRANGRHKGVAPDADLIIVSSDFERPNWRAAVADAVQYILDHAAALGRPVVINASLGTYFGSHDGLDAAALLVDSMLNAAPGRAMVCAAGNSRTLPDYHLSYPVTADTAHTIFMTNYNSGFGVPAAYFELWADTADLNDVAFSLGADQWHTGYSLRRALGDWHRVQDLLGQPTADTLISDLGYHLGTVEYHAELRGGQYRMDVLVLEPDSAEYRWRFSTTGQGRFHVWSANELGSSRITDDLTPINGQNDPMYRYPDTEMRTVDSWACSDKVVTVANYQNELAYTDYTNTLQTFPGTEGEISPSSSNGPTRDGRMKPDLASTGDITMSAAPLSWIQFLIANQPYKVDVGGYHIRGGGTSIASPVVAGTVALLFERCPNATWADVKDALIASARSDGFTGATPNTMYGHGKLDAFAALLAAGPDMTFAVDTTICAGDSVAVNAPADLVDYTWSTGLQNAPFHQSTAGSISIEGYNSAGCFGRSDTLHFTMLPPVPTPTITQQGNTLESSPAAAYQWWLDGQPIPGADQQAYDVAVTGTYAVEIVDAEGCTAMSDPLFVTWTAIASTDAPTTASLHPVPASEELLLTLPYTAVPLDVAVFDAAGHRLVALRTMEPLVRFDVRGWAAGLYAVRIDAEEKRAQVLRFSVR